MKRTVLDWLESRVGYRAWLRHIADEPVPQGAGWFFTIGSVLTLLLGLQFLTGIVLALYYVPAPVLAYESVRHIMGEVPLGWLVRGLHVWSASFVVVAAAVHMARVFFFGSYKAPREVTWLTGVLLFLLILAFSLSGYLLPWDQKAYWATTVTINVARSTPVVGELMAAVLRGGSEIGALTLGRWYVAHVLLLPAALVVFVIAHLVLMRRHGISGPITAVPGPARPFYPWHVMKDTVAMAVVFAGLITVAWLVPAHLDGIADPADATYVPRPEWYFLALFQLLKLLSGPLELMGTIVLPALALVFLLALPFLDRGTDRHPFRRRWPWTAAMMALAGGIVLLTALGVADRPATPDPHDWGPWAIAGHQIATGGTTACQQCHVTGGPGSPLEEIRITRDEEWLLSHMTDPESIVPGLQREPAPTSQPLSRVQAQAVVAYVRRLRTRTRPPAVSAETLDAAWIFTSTCATCHSIAGEGGDLAPDLSQVGARRDAASIRLVLTDPKTEFPDTVMPAYGQRLSAEQMDVLVRYLAGRR